MKLEKNKDEEEGQSFQKMRRADTEQELDESSRISRANLNTLKKARDRKTTYPHNQLMKDPIFRSAFTIQQRTGNWFYNCFRCMDSASSFVNILDEQERKHSVSLSEDMRKQAKDKIIRLKILQSSRLQLDPNVMHPFVKIHIVDKNTGSYLRIFQSDEPVVYSKEQVTFFNQNKKLDSSSNNSLLPFSTNCCDFRELGDSRGIWNQKFFINTKAQDILNPNTVILFQILDFNHQALLYKDTDIYDKDNFYRVAWGFLRPVGLGKNHIGKSKIELYKYKYVNKKADPTFDNNYVPSVYYDFIWNNHQKYEGFLTVQLLLCDKLKYQFVDDDQVPKNIFQEEKKDRKYIEKFISAEDRRAPDQQPQIKQELMRFYRNKNHCQVPKQMIYKLQSAKLGCFRVKFIGNYLFAACSDRNVTSIKVFNLENGEKVMTMKGHRQIIYSMNTNSNPPDGKEKYLITAGSDHLTRIWKIPENYGEYIDEDESQEYLVGQFLHTAAVYSASGILVNLKDIMYTVTCCYDGYIRLWQTSLNSKQKLSRSSKIVKQVLVNTIQKGERVYPICSAISSSNQIYIGQSNGFIRIFNFQNGSMTFQNIVTNPQLSRDAILSIQIVERHLFIQSSDNMVRRFQLSGSKLHEDKKYAGGQYENLLLNCKISPDFRYMIAPSQTGKPVMWDVFTGVTIDIDYLNLNIKGPLTCCDWHPKYNLVVLSGFVEECPIFVYGNILTEAEMRIVLTN